MIQFLKFWKLQTCALAYVPQPKMFSKCPIPRKFLFHKSREITTCDYLSPSPQSCSLIEVWTKLEYCHLGSLLQVLATRVGVTQQMYNYSRQKSRFKIVPATHTHISSNGHYCPESCFLAILKVIPLMPFNTGTASWVLLCTGVTSWWPLWQKI